MNYFGSTLTFISHWQFIAGFTSLFGKPDHKFSNLVATWQVFFTGYYQPEWTPRGNGFHLIRLPDYQLSVTLCLIHQGKRNLISISNLQHVFGEIFSSKLSACSYSARFRISRRNACIAMSLPSRSLRFALHGSFLRCQSTQCKWIITSPLTYCAFNEL